MRLSEVCRRSGVAAFLDVGGLEWREVMRHSPSDDSVEEGTTEGDNGLKG